MAEPSEMGVGFQRAERERAELSAAQETMRSDAATLSQEGFKQRRAEELVLDIIGESSLRLSPLEWDAVRSLVRAGVQAGRELEREA